MDSTGTDSTSNVPRTLSLAWGIKPSTATWDEVTTAYARHRIITARPPGCGAFLVDAETNKAMLKLRAENMAQERGLPY